MFHFTIFGYSEGEIAPNGYTALTLYGYSKLRRPTLAQRIMARRNRLKHPPNRWDRLWGRDRSMVITVFGGSEVVAPTLIEEYSALRGLLKSGAIERQECLDLLGDLARGSGGEAEISRLTVFGGCGAEAPSAKKERKALDAGEEAGVISPAARRELAQAIGCPEAMAADVLARVAMA